MGGSYRASASPLLRRRCDWHRKNVEPQEIANKTFFLPSKSAPSVRRVVLEFFRRAGVDLKPEYEVHTVVHAISMITSMRGVMLLPAYTQRYLPETMTTRPVSGEVPTVDLILA
jgi:LysR family hca operon transcriptional activator